MESSLLARQSRIGLDDPSGVGEARRRAAALATVLGFEATAAGQLALAVTEAATNIVKHAGSGAVLLRALAAGGQTGIEVLALDRGPGIANLAESLRDGHSTAGSPGTGLGALQRLGGSLDIYTQPGQGVILRLELWRCGAAHPDSPAVGAVCLPKDAEPTAGDDWTLVARPGGLLLFLVDGLGHGPMAAAAARAAVAAAERHGSAPATSIMEAVHEALRPTRGAAAAAIVLDAQAGRCTFCGVGNISASIRTGGSSRGMISHNGILGHQIRRIQAFEYPYARGALCIAHTDGLVTRWDLAAYPGLEQRHPALIAAALYRDHDRRRDDVTIVAVRER